MKQPASETVPVFSWAENGKNRFIKRLFLLTEQGCFRKIVLGTLCQR
jgi:hypothetical protein